MKIYKLLGSILVLCLLVACRPEKELESVESEYPFWSDTIAAIEAVGESSDTDENGVSASINTYEYMDKEALPSVFAHQRLQDTGDNKEDVYFSFENDGSENLVSYSYRFEENLDDRYYESMLKIKSTNADFSEYTMTYTRDEYRNGNYFDSISAEGVLKIGTNNKITYDDMPLLSEAMPCIYNLMTAFEEKYEIDYSDYDFICLPELAKNTTFSKTTTIRNNASTTLYRSEPVINARGYSRVTFLEVENDFSTAQFGIYFAEKEVYETNDLVPLEKRSIDNCYNIVQGDPDVPYAVYFTEDVAYLYQQDTSDADIEADIASGGTNAKMQLLFTEPQIGW